MQDSVPVRRFEASQAWVRLLAIWGLACLGTGLYLLLVLESSELSGPFVSQLRWESLVKSLGGTIERTVDGSLLASVSAGSLVVAAALATLVFWFGGTVVTRLVERQPFAVSMLNVGERLWPWWLIPTSWSVLWLAAGILGWTPGVQLLQMTVDLAAAATLAGQLAVVCSGFGQGLSPRAWKGLVALAILAYVATFTAMNWGLWSNLRLPHGDSAMYEEHLWNLLHGKGFRSYLDQGLFLGEHIQVVHVLLVPLFVLWPSHPWLELLQSAALASTAIPVYVIAKRHSGSDRAAGLLAIAALLYFPVQYLDVAIDLKTFRPSAFGIPLILWTIDAMERRAWKTMWLFVALTLTVQEDFAIPLGLVGFWLLATSFFRRDADLQRRTDLLHGTALWVFCMVYVFVAVKYAIPWFRDGGTVHYVRYFAKFGDAPTEIVWNMLTKPGLLFSQLITPGTITYALHLLLPLAFLPLRSPARALTALPLYLLLCLNELAQQPPSPVHHFHAPVIPLLLWAAAGGLTPCAAQPARGRCPDPAIMAVAFALMTSVLYSMSPLGLRFWDPGRPQYWRSLYVMDERAKAFTKIEDLIPPTARVASTDFVHPRYTHFERSYDYSDYPRRVANYEDKVPDDTDYIVIDTQHPYSRVRSLDDVRELQREPEKWEVLPDETDGYFIVLRRRR